MKVTSKKQSAKFVPQSVTITFETQKELDVFASMFNTCCVCDSLDELIGKTDSTDVLCDELEKIGGEANLYTSELTNKIGTHPSI